MNKREILSNFLEEIISKSQYDKSCLSITVGRVREFDRYGLLERRRTYYVDGRLLVKYNGVIIQGRWY